MGNQLLLKLDDVHLLEKISDEQKREICFILKEMMLSYLHERLKGGEGGYENE